MPLPVLINHPEKTTAFLPDIPLDLIVLSHALSALVTSPIALRGKTVLNHIFRVNSPINQLDFRITSSVTINIISNLQRIAEYSAGKINLNGIPFTITFINSDNLLFKLETTHGEQDILIKVYDYNTSFHFDLNTIEILFSQENPNGLVKLDERQLEALSNYVVGQPQINYWFRRSFKSDSATMLPYSNMVKVLFNILKLTEENINVLHFSKLSTSCSKCNSIFNETGNSHPYVKGLYMLGYAFKCGHYQCLACILKQIKNHNGPAKCHVCMQDLQHISLPEEWEIKWDSVKSLFTYFKTNQNIEENHTGNSEFNAFKLGIDQIVQQNS